MADLPFRLEEFPEYPQTGFGWPIAPEHLRTTLIELQERYAGVLPPVYITENGASFPEVPDSDGFVDDAARIDYIAAHLGSALDAVAPGGGADRIELLGFFVWSLLDNWEWAAGFTQRFGIVEVDFATGERTPKASYRWLRDAIAARSRG